MSQSTTIVSLYILRCIPPRNTSILEKQGSVLKVGAISTPSRLDGLSSVLWRSVYEPEADISRDIPLGDTFKTIKPLSPKIHSFARSCRSWAVDLRYRIRVFLSKAGTVVAE